jgi:uncharacterized protein YoxC
MHADTRSIWGAFIFAILAVQWVQLSGLVAAIDGLRQDVGAIRMDVGVLRKDSDMLRQDVGMLRQDVGEHGTQLRELGTQVREQGTQVREQGTQVREQGAQVRELGTQVRELGTQVRELGTQVRELGTQVSEQGAQVREHGALLREHSALLREHSALLAGLAETAVTPAVGARLEACSRTTVVAAFVFFDAHPAKFEQCSAVPLPENVLGSPGAPASTYFLTSAHCFMNKDGEIVSNNMTLSFMRAVYKCRLLKNFMAPPANATSVAASDKLDLAVVRCPVAVPIAPARLSLTPYAAQTPAVLVGFTRGVHLDYQMTAGLKFSDLEYETYALHTKVSRLSSSFQMPDSMAGLYGSSGSSSLVVAEDGPLPAKYSSVLPVPWSAATGYVDLSPWGGMSGGAVTDIHCGLFGVTERRSVYAVGGTFVRLVPEVLTRIALAIASGA